MNPAIQWLNDGRRLHLQHGPIDLIVDVCCDENTRKNSSDAGAVIDGDLACEAAREAARNKDAAVERAAFQLAIDRFNTVLTELVEELPALRTPTDAAHCQFKGKIARRMWQAAGRCEGAITAQESSDDSRPCRSFNTGKTTPMIAVAGSVADEVLAAMLSDAVIAEQIHRVSVNNGGDIALYLNQAARYRVGVVANPDDPCISGSVALGHTDGVGGIATSGWRGRSYSLGIADSVTVLAPCASIADAAATLIANAVNIETSCESDDTVCARYDLAEFVERQPACELDPDSDLGETLVTTRVSPLPQPLIDRALNAGCKVAVALEQRKIISAACLFLQGSNSVIGQLGNAIHLAEPDSHERYSEEHYSEERYSEERYSEERYSQEHYSEKRWPEEQWSTNSAHAG